MQMSKLLSFSKIQSLKKPNALDEEALQKNSQLQSKIKSLHLMGLSAGNELKNIVYPGHIRISTVHNDYHNSKTNGGYSRNKMGGIFPK
jgi:hypothetical protein